VTIFILLLCAVACDILGQVCFKLGIDHDDDDAGEEDPRSEHGLGRFLVGIVQSPMILVGVGVYTVEFIVYFAALTLAPLSMAYPFNALSYCGVVLASRFLLQERVSLRRWMGTVAIAFGVALVCWP
jgi:undecaprenyl phosphate-alpha-L-ara4N flippase subunit ArnE